MLDSLKAFYSSVDVVSLIIHISYDCIARYSISNAISPLQGFSDVFGTLCCRPIATDATPDS